VMVGCATVGTGGLTGAGVPVGTTGLVGPNPTA
jgi:hypothetical protein